MKLMYIEVKLALTCGVLGRGTGCKKKKKKIHFKLGNTCACTVCVLYNGTVINTHPGRYIHQTEQKRYHQTVIQLINTLEASSQYYNSDCAITKF